MADNPDSDFETIGMRNALRAEAQLPLLDVQAELLRLEAVREEAAFEKYFEVRRDQYKHLWDRKRGFWTKMATYNEVRKKLREEMQKDRA